ncbi:hypothetical protein [Crystallibacter crystallopoietes]|uniref:hypothetical protein n=1 Tax=Crystallibacter crystallopoietes TaxID=37928 RepID=UPI0012376CD1|nr:hypothetical protein [Arthrobacter crystallopoietes]
MKSDDIWNRALDYDYDGPRAEGDRALHDLLLLDNMAQNGGLLHAVQGLEPHELTAAVAGYRWFGLDSLADGIESVAEEAPGATSLEQAEALEVRADDLYFGEEGSDLIDPAFTNKLAEQPDAFADSAP